MVGREISATMPAKMISEDAVADASADVICSPSHIRNMRTANQRHDR